MNNQEYVKSLGISEEAQQTCLDVMAKYGENHWWEEGVDDRTLAYYQVLEPIMLVSSFSRFHKATELLLNRPVYSSEFGLSARRLEEEAKRAYEDGVTVTTDEERHSLMAKALSDVIDVSQDKQVIIVSIDEEGEN